MEDKKKKPRKRPPKNVGNDPDRIKTAEEAQAVIDEVNANLREFHEPENVGDEVWDMGRPRSARPSESLANGDRVGVGELKLTDSDVDLISDANVEGIRFTNSLQMDSFIGYMLTGLTWRQAAASAGVGVRVAAKWMRRKSVRKRMQKFREILAESALTRIASLTNSAVTVLEDSMSADNHVQFRLQGAKLLFDALTKMNQIVGMEQRLREIEDSLGVGGTALPHHATATGIQQMTAGALENMASLGLDLPGENGDGIQRPVDTAQNLAR